MKARPSRANHSERGERVRVLFFDHTAAMSGGEIALFNLLQHLNRAIFDPVVVLGADGPLASRLRASTAVHILPLQSSVAHARKDRLGVGSVLRAGPAWSALIYVFMLARWMRRNGIELVHTNSLKSDALGGLAARLAGTRVVWHLRDRIAEDYLPPRVVKGFRWLASWVPTAIVANSQATASTITGRRGRHKPLYVVHDGVPAQLFRFRGNQPADPGPQIVGIIGRISPWKGQDVFVRAAQIVRRAYPAVRFRIIGAALFEEVQFDAALRSLVRELALEEAVEFRGFCEDVAAEMTELDVFVHASTRPEPFGQVIIEAMAAGIPVVATKGGGVLEIVQSSLTGLLVPMGDAASMAHAITRLLADPTLARTLAARARRHVENSFSMEQTAEKMERILLRVARGDARGRLKATTAPAIVK